MRRNRSAIVRTVLPRRRSHGARTELLEVTRPPDQEVPGQDEHQDHRHHAGEVAIAAPLKPSTMLLKPECDKLTGQTLPDHARSQPYQTPPRVRVTITMGTTIQRLPALW
jgi:hypothetical protein